MKEFRFRTLNKKDIPDMHNAFNQAFSDYLIPMEITENSFRRKIIQKTNIQFKYSVGAFDKDRLAGFIFNTIGNYENKKSAYNGGTGVIPEYRGHQLTRKMYEYLLPDLVKNNIEQCVLEVISDNRAAIKAYERIGFRKTRFYHCLKLHRESSYLSNHAKNKSIQSRFTDEPSWNEYSKFCDYGTSFLDTFESLKKSKDRESFMELHDGKNLVGFIIFNKNMGRIEHLAVHPKYRGMGIGASMIKETIRKTGNKPVYILNIDERYYGLLNFFLRLGFKNEIDQFELTLNLSDKIP